ncbi:oligosaccharide flippase family protein [Candidatus Woesebacteria bacterium]|nr:oligosaccharide flippase family protein [Candidatus Woesebacteria bacterium]
MAANVVNYGYHVVMGRLLGPADYGVLLSIFSLLYIVSIVPLSTSISIVKFISTAKDEDVGSVYDGIKKFIYKIAFIGSLLLLLLAYPISTFLHISNILLVLMVSPVMFFSLVTLVDQATLQGLMKFGGVVIPNMISSVGKLGLGILFIFLGWSVLGATFAIFLSVFLAWIYVRSVIPVSLRGGVRVNFNLAPFIKFSLPALLQALAFTSLITTDVLLAKHFLSDFDAGLYGSLAMLGKIIYFAASPVVGVLFPIVSKRHSNKENYRHIFLVALFMTLGISLGVLMIYLLMPGFVIRFSYGQKYLVAQNLLFLMGLTLSIYTLCYLLVNYLLSMNQVKVVVLPILAALFQPVLIFIFWHGSIFQIIMSSLFSMSILLVLVIVFFKVGLPKYVKS